MSGWRKLRMELKRWPRKNDPDSIRARQKALGLTAGDARSTSRRSSNAQEMLTGAAVIPVSVVGPLERRARRVRARGAFRPRLRDGPLARTQVFVPLAHTEGGLSASLYRGARAAAESGGFRTYVLADRITRASCFVCKLDGGGGAARALPRCARRGDAPLARASDEDAVDLAATRGCARSRRMSSARCATSSGPSRPGTPAART